MDIISFNEASTANGRIENFIENPDSMSGIVTIPKVIASGETITIPAGRIAVLPNVQVDGTLNISGEVFIPSGATFGDLEDQLALKAPLASPALTGTPTAPTQTVGDNSTKIATTAYVDGKMVLGTAVTATGTAIDFTNIPSWVKKITVMFNGVSTNGSSNPIVRIGSDTIETSGYLGSVSLFTTSAITSNSYPSSCFQLYAGGGASSVILNGRFELINIDSNSWVQTHVMARTDTSSTIQGSGTITLQGELNKIRVTTLNGTDLFDNGQINIMYEG